MVVSNQKRAIGVALNRQEVESALSKLQSANFPLGQTSVIAKDLQPSDQFEGVETSEQLAGQSTENPTGLPADGVTTASWSTLLVGLTSFAIPGAGPILAAGTLGVSLLTGLAGIGMGVVANNNLIQAFKELGVPEDKARLYSDRLTQGNYIILLEGTEDEISRADETFEQGDIHGWGVYQTA